MAELDGPDTDLTALATRLRRALQPLFVDRDEVSFVAVELDRIARPAVARTDAPCQGTCTGCGAGEDQVCAGSCRCVASGVHDRDGYTPDMPEYTAPDADTAPAAPEDRINAVRELLAAICDPMDQAEAEAHLDLLGVTRAEVDEANRRTAGQPVRDSQDGGA